MMAEIVFGRIEIAPAGPGMGMGMGAGAVLPGRADGGTRGPAPPARGLTREGG